MTDNGISSLNQFTLQSGRLADLRGTFDDLQRQITTGKRHENLSAFGADAQKLLRLHTDTGRLQSYISNIDATAARIKAANSSMDQILKIAQDLAAATVAPSRSGGTDVATISTIAKNTLKFMFDITNMNIDGRYLFSGTDSANAPIADKTAADTSFQAQISDWLAGTIDTTQLLNNTDAFSAAELGFSGTISSAELSSIRVDDAMEVDYGAIATQAGFDKVIHALAFAANLSELDPAVDVPTNADMNTVMGHIVEIVREGINTIQQANIDLGSNSILINNMKDTHLRDINVFEAQIEGFENADPAEAITLLQALQTQMAASYNVTKISSQLSLVNFLDF